MRHLSFITFGCELCLSYKLRKDRSGNSQVLISAYMKMFVLLPKIKNDNDISELRNLYDQIESSFRNLKT